MPSEVPLFCRARGRCGVRGPRAARDRQRRPCVLWERPGAEAFVLQAGRGRAEGVGDGRLRRDARKRVQGRLEAGLLSACG